MVRQRIDGWIGWTKTMRRNVNKTYKNVTISTRETNVNKEDDFDTICDDNN